MRLRAFLPLMALCLAACSTAPVSREASPSPAHNNLNSTVWMQNSAEYEAVTRGAFQNAIEQLRQAAADPDWNALPEAERSAGGAGLPLAVIVDADETMVDNSPYQARNIRDNASYSIERWQQWVNEQNARAVPGALQFAKQAEALGVTIFFVTNRAYPAEYAGTVGNLRKLGFPLADDNSNLLLMGDPRAPEHEKGTRRRWVGERYRVALLMGDNLGDFVDGYRTTVEQRQALVERYADWWGTRWIMLPNPAYGSWESAVRLRCRDAQTPGCLRQGLRYD